MNPTAAPSPARRSFLSILKAGTAAAAALAFAGRAKGQSKAAGRFEPARHDQDNWMDEIPGKHRMVFDTVNNDSIGEALLFANNFLLASRNGYGLQNSDQAVIVVARHMSTGFAFNNAMWAKYSAQLSSLSSVTPAATSNPRNAGGFGLEGLAKQGVHFAVCAMATSRIANSIAQATGSKAEEITAELTANLVPNARMVPAGIVAVNRAQERGYSLCRA